MARKKISMDGNQAAAHAAYAFTEVAGIYPITPSSPMADFVDLWAANGLKNIFGTTTNVIEMQSEGGAAGTVHGSLAAGALTTTFTASQGLLLMIPNMYKIAAEQLPAVFHVSARTVATQALSIFGDHSDVYACRQTGFAMLAESNPQEVMDLSPVAHLSAIQGLVPFINFFDGFRTSHEVQKIEAWDYNDLKDMYDMEALKKFRAHALNPEHPAMRGSHENGDIFFQHREACNPVYDALPEIVRKNMQKINAKLGTDYDLFNYYGAPDADRVIVAMGSVCNAAEEVIDYLLNKGEKVGLIKVRLYRPWYGKAFLESLPKTVKKLAVLDRTKEPGSLGEPLFMDVAATLREAGMNDLILTGGRYGLASKDTPPSSIFAVFTELQKDAPKPHFTIGIVDDVTNLSLPEVKPAPITAAAGTVECKFWGIGGDGTVGANKDSIKIIGDHTDKYVQAYFQYDSKKTGGITISHLRFGDKPIKSSYYITQADFVACHNQSYIIKGYKMVQDVKKGGSFLINCLWSDEELDKNLPAAAKKYIADNQIKLYTINAVAIAQRIGLGKRTSTVLQSAFFQLANVLPAEEAIRYMKEKVTQKFAKKGQDIVDMNCKAIDEGCNNIHEVQVPASWANPEADAPKPELNGTGKVVSLVKNLMEPINLMDGDSLPVSAFKDMADGQFEIGTAAFEKRGAAVSVPRCDQGKCIQCSLCSFVCSHATIRPFLLDENEMKAAPENLVAADTRPKPGKYKFTISISTLDCTGCGECLTVCPTNALEMQPLESCMEQQPVFDYLVANVTKKEDAGFNDLTPKGSQFNKPLLEFSGACAGCAETAYARLVTQLFGEQMYITNATGCSSIWGGPAASCPYTVNQESGKGPAWSNSLFEDNAEHGLGMHLGQKHIRDALIAKLEALASSGKADDALKEAITRFMETKNNTRENIVPTEKLITALEKCNLPEAKDILDQKEFLGKKSVWIMGGDGWAYDIGYGGLDHVLASGEDINVMVFDTEMYSNTGGQLSKASNVGEICQFAASGKDIGKKSLAELAMTYGYVYTAQLALSANPGQTIKAIAEAEAYNGPSLLICYAPCELHGIRGGMNHCQDVLKSAVKSGYWNLFSFNPELKAQGKNPFTLSSRAGDGSYQDFLNNETRYSALKRKFPERGELLFARNEKFATDRFKHLQRLVELYKPAD